MIVVVAVRLRGATALYGDWSYGTPRVASRSSGCRTGWPGAVTDLELAAQPFAEGPDRLETQLAVLLRRAKTEGRLATTADPDVESARLLALSRGLGIGTSVLVGRRTPVSAMELLGYHLDRLFTLR
ncbi:TetR family transcriptional regulator C-terminal domain-containing protein [Streptomyces sp. HMX87]|uniref:TetR family transcriptional regulator C-terminal domain-containing protein n=1 Tax=Streptomyces sp. HMX87 TaxID=3390849 RepID=UPI003A8A9A69